jgi:hypothetical protein
MQWQEDTAYGGSGVINDVDDRVHYHASAYGIESRTGVTRDEAQGRVEDDVSCWNVVRCPSF